MTWVHQWSKVNFIVVYQCLLNDLLFALGFIQLPCWNRLKLLPFFIHCSLRIRNSHCLEHWKCAPLWCNTEFCRFTAIWSSWLLFVTDSILGLVDSCASATQLNLVFVSDASAFAFFNATVSRVWAIVLLHGIAAAIGVSNFRFAFLMMSL